MKFTVKILCALLALLLTMTAITACVPEDDAPGATDGATTESANTPAPETDLLEDSLKALDGRSYWQGDFGILYTNDFFGYDAEVEADMDKGSDTAAGIINDAVYERNTLFEELCDLDFVTIPVSSDVATARVQAEAQTATGDFQLVTMKTRDTAAAATTGVLYNYLDLDLEFERPWWDQGTLDFALDGRVFFMNGPFNMVDDNVTFVMMFNKDLYKDYQVEDPYATVARGDWTLPYFNSVISNLSTDNGDGVWTDHDTYGFATPNSIGDTLFYGAGLRYVNNSRDVGEPQLVLDEKMEQALNVMDIARSIVHENHSTYVAPSFYEDLAKNMFVQGRSLFYCEAASYLGALNAEMEDEYGVLPLPKYDTNQEKYTTWIHSSGSTLSIPTSVARGDMELFENVLETYVLLSQKVVKPAFYDTMLTVRNVQDVESSEMLDMIFMNRTYDMAIYFESLGFANLFASSVLSDGADFTSAYKAESKSFNKRVANILRKLQKME